MTLAKYLSKRPRRCFSFAFVRNPYARLLSAFDHLNQSPLNEGDRADARRYVLKYRGDFEAFVVDSLSRKMPAVLSQIHFRPQYEWICDKQGVLLTNFVGKLENLARDLKALERKIRIGLSADDLPHWHRLDRPCYRDSYSNRTRKIVERTYEKDLSLFSYRF
jgi:hypothetical protein